MYPEAHEIEKNIGIKFYTTKTPGINGKTRLRLDDFIVKEEAFLQISQKKGPYCVFLLEKHKLSTLDAIHHISRRLKLKKNVIGYAGLKDANAVTLQYISIPSRLLEGLYDIKQPIIIDDGRIKLKFLGYSYIPISLSILKGNRFIIKIHDAITQNLCERIECIKREILLNMGIPSFFGHQRFGIRRPNTHIIGKYIVLKLWEEAINELIGHPYPYEHEILKEARRLAEEGEYNEALKLMPKKFWYERKILKLLIEGYKPLEILRKLPRGLLKLFIQAYQSYIYNLILSKRLELGLKPREAIEGDLVLNIRSGQIRYERMGQLLSQNETILLPVPGFRIKRLPQHYSWCIVKEILENEGINFNSFKINELKIVLHGTLRYTPFQVQYFTYNLSNEQDKTVLFSFSLDKGMYATIVLREFMKCDPIHFT